MPVSEQQYEDVLVTQMNSLWFDEPVPIEQRRKRRSINSLSFSRQDLQFTDVSLDEKSSSTLKKKKKWMKRINSVISNYSKPVGKEMFAKTELLISTPFDFNHLGHISEADTFGVDTLFHLKESNLVDLHGLSPLAKQRKEKEQEYNEAKDSYAISNDTKPKRSSMRGVSSFTTMPVDGPKVIKRSISEKSVNSSMLFSRSNSITTVATNVSLMPSQKHKQSMSGHSLKSLMELEKTHQRSLSGGGRIHRLKSVTSTHDSLADSSTTNSVVEEIKEEEDVSEEEPLDIPEVPQEILDNYELSSPSSPYVLKDTSTPLVEREALEWDASPMSFMRSSWIYKDGSPAKTSLLENDSDKAEVQSVKDDSSFDELLMASFKAGKFSRRSRLSIMQNNHRGSTVYYADNACVGSELLPPASF